MMPLRDIDPELKKFIEEKYGRGAGAAIAPMRSSGSPNARWHLAQIFSGTEAIVAERLKKQTFGIYYPMLRVMKAVPRKQQSRKQRDSGIVPKRPALEVFLPGYMFVHFDYENDRWHDVFELAGVRGLHCHGDLPKQVPDSLIEGWQAMEQQGAIPGGAKIHSLFPFRLGETVRVNEGPFTGFLGTIDKLPDGYQEGSVIEELDGSKRVGLLVAFFGRETAVNLAVGQFDKA